MVKYYCEMCDVELAVDDCDVIDGVDIRVVFENCDETRFIEGNLCFDCYEKFEDAHTIQHFMRRIKSG